MRKKLHPRRATFTILLLCIGLPGCGASTSQASCKSVRDIKAHAASCSGRELRLHAYVTWTRHGTFLSDNLDDKDVLGATFSESPQHQDSSQLILDLLYVNGGAVSSLRGEFFGKLLVEGNHVHFELYSGRDLARAGR